MPKKLLLVLTILSFSTLLVGCSNPSEQVDVKRDRLDPESLKALEHPPPGVPGVAAKPGSPAGVSATTTANAMNK